MATLKSLVDETTNIKNEIVECCDNLKDILVNKDISCDNTDKLSTLIDKVGDIELGKKWASGTFPAYRPSGNVSSYKITINTNLQFTPSVIIFITKGIWTHSLQWNTNLVVTNLAKTTLKVSTDKSTTASYSIENITNNSFDFVFSTTASHNAQYQEGTWYAFE